MTNDNKTGTHKQTTRQRAEMKAQRNKSFLKINEPEKMNPMALRVLLNGLHVHQIELEMQNDELRIAQDILSRERSRYFDLYNLAPVGYFTISGGGLILEANLTAATLLDRTPESLVRQPFSLFIGREDQDSDYLNRKRLMESTQPKSYELRMVKKNGTVFWVHIMITLSHDANNEQVCRAVVSDITERKLIEDAENFLMQSPHVQSGMNYFCALAQYLGTSLHMDYVHIDRLELGKLRSHTVAVWQNGAIKENRTYIIAGTPFSEAIGQPFYCHESEMSRLFPKDALLRELNAESCFIASLQDSKGNPNGLIVAISSRRTHNRTIVEAVLKMAALRTAGELEQLQAMKDIANIANIPDENPNPILRLDRKGTVLYANKAAHSLQTKLLPNQWHAPIAKSLKSNSIQNIILEHNNRQLSFDIVPCLPQEYVNLYSHDITTQRQLEQSLRETSEYLDKLIDCANAPIVVWNPAMVITRANRAFERVTGRSASELVGQNLSQLFPPESRKQNLALIKKSLEQGHLETVDIQVISSRGQIRYLIWNSANVLDRHGRVISTIAQGHDITRRQEAEDALAESENRLRSVIQNIDEYIYILDYRDGQLISSYHSPQCTRITGHDPSEYATDPNLWFNMIQEDDRPAVLQYIKAIGEEKKLPPVEHRIIHKDGSIRWILNNCTLEKSNGIHLQRMEGFIIDITARVEMENRLREATTAAQNANRTKSDFLAAMSHELRTPLNAILGFGQVLAMQKEGPLNKIQQRYLENIQNGGERLLTMINDILDLSKIEAGKIELEKELFDLPQELLHLMETVRPLADQKSITINPSVAADLGMLEADKSRISQIMLNLLSNAIKFTPDGKTIGVEAQGEGSSVSLTVWDEGIGMAEADLARIFDPFEQLHRQKNGPKGTGLGLAITKQLVKLHGGKIEVHSAPDKGSRFVVILNGLHPPENQAKSESPILAPIDKPICDGAQSSQAIRVMVVEDSEINRELMQVILHSLGIPARFAECGEDALQLAEKEEFDLVLMDIDLPGMSGLETQRQLRSAIKKPIRIIALTGHTMKGDEERFVAGGMDGVLTKPIKIDKLKAIFANIHTA